MLLKLYDKNNNPQDLQRVTDILNDGGIIIYPTDFILAEYLNLFIRCTPSDATG